MTYLLSISPHFQSLGPCWLPGFFSVISCRTGGLPWCIGWGLGSSTNKWYSWWSWLHPSEKCPTVNVHVSNDEMQKEWLLEIRILTSPSTICCLCTTVAYWSRIACWMIVWRSWVVWWSFGRRVVQWMKHWKELFPPILIVCCWSIFYSEVESYPFFKKNITMSRRCLMRIYSVEVSKVVKVPMNLWSTLLTYASIVWLGDKVQVQVFRKIFGVCQLEFNLWKPKTC